MNGDRHDPSDLAQRIADGETVDLDELEARDPKLARGLRKLSSLARSMADTPAEGRRWGHLCRLEPVAHGGFGEVFRAYDPTLDRIVALKLKREDAQDAFASGRDFVAEARRLARVRHPNVLAVHGASYHEGRAGLWSDWIDGETLAARIARTGALRGPELLRILHELASAIDAVHGAGLVHGDIKASNVMLDSRQRVVLMDFGAGFESGTSDLGLTAGTPRYLAPEVAAGAPAGTAVDMYAFGVLAHLLATTRYPPPAGVDATAGPIALRRLLHSLLKADPRARPTSSALVQALHRIVEAPRRRARRWLQASVAAGLVGVALATTIGLYRENRQRATAEVTAEFFTELLAAPAPEAQGREVKAAELLDAAAARLAASRELSPLVRARLLLTIGRSQLALLRFGRAESALEAARALDRPAGSIPSADALQIGLQLARAKNRRQRPDEADAVLRELAADSRWRDDTQAIAAIAVARAEWWYYGGDYARAMDALAPALREDAAITRETRLEALISRSQIAFEQRNLADTEAAARQAVDLLTSLDRPFGTREMEARTILANAVMEQGRFAEGETAYRDLAARAETAYGRDSMWGIGAWGNVAVAINSQGRHGDAVALLRDVIPRAEALDDGGTRIALVMRSTLAAALTYAGDPLAALTEYETLLPNNERIFGPEHTQTLIDRFNRVEALNTAGRHETALTDGRALRADMARVVGEEHPFTLETDDAIGYALTALHRGAEAEALHRRTITRKSASIGADNPYTLTSREYLARALLEQGRDTEARSELVTLLADRERILGPTHPKSETVRRLLASVP